MISVAIAIIWAPGHKVTNFVLLLPNRPIRMMHLLYGGVMFSVLASSEEDRGSSHGRVKPKTIKLVCVASPLSTQH
jgi:hypothetical protein